MALYFSLKLSPWFNKFVPKFKSFQATSQDRIFMMENAQHEFERDQLYEHDEEQPCYVPSEFVNPGSNDDDYSVCYRHYTVELDQSFDSEMVVNDFVLCVRSTPYYDDIENSQFEIEFNCGWLSVNIKYDAEIHMNTEEVRICRAFQTKIFGILINHSSKKLDEDFGGLCLGDQRFKVDYLLLPGTKARPSDIDWQCVESALFSHTECDKKHIHCSLPNGCSDDVHTLNGVVCSCMILDSLVYTPHSGTLYHISKVLDELNGNSLLQLRKKGSITYKNHYESRHGINLQYDTQFLLEGRHIFSVQKPIPNGGLPTKKESKYSNVELPPELCSIIMSPISINTLYTFSFVPAIMHHLEAILVALHLKRMLWDQGMPTCIIPTVKVLEAITTKNCQEKVHLESLATLGDSFLKFAVSQQLFRTYQNDNQGILSGKKDRIVSNPALCKLGFGRKLPGFIRNELFDPKKWVIPGDLTRPYTLKKEWFRGGKNVYIKGTRNMKMKMIADVIEALIGAFLISAGEMDALYFINWVGIKVDFAYVPYDRNFRVQPERLIDVEALEMELNYSFHDPSLLVEALTHGSYRRPESAKSYQRLEFLGDAVLDYVITDYFYKEYPGMSSGDLTDMRSASVNNECYALSVANTELHNHILHASPELNKRIVQYIDDLKNAPTESTFGWESETSFPKVLADIIESLAGAIFLDSGYDTNVVFESICFFLEPLVTPETMKLQPARELGELCAKRHYYKKQPVKSIENDVHTVTVEVKADGVTYKHTSKASNFYMAERFASKGVLRWLK